MPGWYSWFGFWIFSWIFEIFRPEKWPLETCCLPWYKKRRVNQFFHGLRGQQGGFELSKIFIFDNFLHHLQIQIRRKSKWEMNQSEAFIKEREYATRLRWFNWILLADGSKNATNSKYFGHTVWLILYKSWWLISMGSTELLCPNMLFEIDYSG